MPFGLPVEPEVNVIRAVPVGSATGLDGENKPDAFLPVADQGWRQALEMMCEVARQTPPAPRQEQPAATDPPPENQPPWTDQQLEELSPVQRKLLREMWGHERRELADLADPVWDGEVGNVTTPVSLVNKFLQKIGYRRVLSKVTKEPAVRWKDCG